MRRILRTAIFSIFILACAATVESQVIAADGADAGFLSGTKITGVWRINHAESDNPVLEMQAALQNKLLQSPDGKTSVKPNALPAMSVSLVPPETLILAGDENSITVNENFSEIVFTRTLATDGKKRTGELQGGAVFSIAATRTSDFLKIELHSPRGNKMTEIYAVAAGGNKLVVTLRFEDAEGREMLALRRVYDRTVPDIFAPGAEEIQ